MLKGVHVTLMIGPAVPVAAPRVVMEALTGIQVTASGGQRSGFQLTLAAGKSSPLTTTMLPSGALDPGVRVIIVVTLNGRPTVLMDGIISRQDVAPSNEVGGSTITITGEDLSVLMDLIDFSGVPFPAMPDVAIAELLMLKYAGFGIVPIAIPTPLTEIPVPTSRWTSQSGTDLAQIRRMAQAAGYVFYLDPGPTPGTSVGYFGPEIRIGVPQPALTVNSDAGTNVESLSFSYDGLSQEQVILFVQEPTTKLPIPIPIPQVTLLKPPLALKPAVPRKLRLVHDSSKLHPVRAALVALARVSSSADAITGSGQLDVLRYGHILKPRGIVGVRGAGPAYDGLYFVKTVTHSIKAGEYKQSFQLSREGLISQSRTVTP